MPKKPSDPQPRAPERPDEDAARVFPDAALTDDARYQNLRLENQDRAGARARDVTFERVQLERVSFKDSKLTQPRLYDASFASCDLSGCTLEKLVGQRLEFTDCRSLGASLSEAVLDDLRVTGGDWRYGLLMGARLKNTFFKRVDLREASFQGANLSGVRFVACDLSRTDFRDANLTGTDFRGSRLGGLIAHAKDVRGAIVGLDQAVDLVHLLGVTLD